MSVTVAIRFPLGRYHATPWDRSVNEGAAEWPPAPWRLLRGLVATWYTRWPDLPAPVLDGLLEALGEPPSYRTPPVSSGHTRHYLPDLDHKKGETGNTDLTLDPYLRVSRDEELLVHWEVEITEEQRATLGKLVELMPYLGRAESVCQARVLDTEAVPDQHWWRPTPDGAETVRLMAARRPVSRPALELTTVEMRRQRRTMPPGATWVTYGRAAADRSSGGPSRAARYELTPVTAVRFAVKSRAPLMATHGVLLADVARRRVIRKCDGGPREVLGHERATTDHQHAHWLPVPDGSEQGRVETFLVWVPAGLTADEVAAIAASDLRGLSGRLGGDQGYEVKGLPMVDLLLQAAGPVDTVAPELCGPARRWRSLTPYLPVRHRKRESLDDYVRADVCKELAYRSCDPQQVTVWRAGADEGLPDRWARSFRRYRISENMTRARQGLGVQLEFRDAVSGPLALGQLSHFGFGLFAPDD